MTALPIDRRATLTLLAASALVPAMTPPAPAQAPMDRIAEWFKIHPAALEHWRVENRDGDPLRVTVKAREAHTGPVSKVMVIYPRKSTAYDIAMTELLTSFHDKGIPTEFEVVNFDLQSERGNELVDEAEREGYRLIYSMGSQTTAWLWKHRRDGKVPIVTICSKDPVQLGQLKRYDQGSGANFAFTSLNVLVDVQMAYLRTLMPELTNVAILVDRKNVSAVKTQAEPMERAARNAGINAFQVAVTDPDRAREQLVAMMPGAVARMRDSDPGLKNSLFWITGSTSVFVEIKTINAEAGKVPVLSVVPEIVQAGPDSATLSIGVSFQSNAQLAAKYGADILLGKARARELKVGIVSPPNIAVSFLRARAIDMKVPFSLFEAADDVYGYDGKPLRRRGRDLLREARAEPR